MNTDRLTRAELHFYLQLESGQVLPPNDYNRQMVKRVREKLGPGIVENRPGEGYIIGAEDNPGADMSTWKVKR